MLLSSKLPRWLEKLILQALKGAITPADVADAIAKAKASIVEKLRGLALATSNKLDDRIVDMVEQALTTCSDDLAFLCDLIERGEVALVEFLRTAAQRSDTILDDAAVEILAEALGVEKAKAQQA